MCGITARIGRDRDGRSLLVSLENLEYRGYDSAGIAVGGDGDLSVEKCEGKVEELEASLSATEPDGRVGIGHTRWSTHGPPSDCNAHPHTSCEGSVAVVHNGIIENHHALRAELEARGHEFTSDTDTEVVPHLVEERLSAGVDPETAFRDAVERLDGSYALAMIVEEDATVYATRQESPLALGLGENANYLASDVPAFIEFTKRVVYPKDGDVLVVDADDYRIADDSGTPVSRPVETVEWDAEDAEKGGYDHYMLKEIHEQPTALRRTLDGRIDDGDVVLADFPPGSFTDVSRVHIVACGTSYHAGLYGQQLLSNWGVSAQTYIASEYGTDPPPADEDTLVIGVTQSGETADTLEALSAATERGARTLAVTNVVGSTAARECDDALFIRAGPEIGVAATKTFSSQVATLVLLGERLVRDVTGSPTDGHEERLDALESLPSHVGRVVDGTDAPQIGRNYLAQSGHFFIGRGTAFPVALEGALKFKEITYEHAEGFAGGELKHGPLALVTPETPVFAVCTGRHETKLASNVNEIQTRGGSVVGVAPENATELVGTADDVLTIPDTHPELVAVLANVQLQLVAYHAAAEIGRPIDKPRNLAKSVTVE